MNLREDANPPEYEERPSGNGDQGMESGLDGHMSRVIRHCLTLFGACAACFHRAMNFPKGNLAISIPIKTPVISHFLCQILSLGVLKTSFIVGPSTWNDRSIDDRHACLGNKTHTAYHIQVPGFTEMSLDRRNYYVNVISVTLFIYY